MATNFVGFIHRMYFRTLVDGAVYGKKCMGVAGRRQLVAQPCGLNVQLCSASS